MPERILEALKKTQKLTLALKKIQNKLPPGRWETTEDGFAFHPQNEPENLKIRVLLKRTERGAYFEGHACVLGHPAAPVVDIEWQPRYVSHWPDYVHVTLNGLADSKATKKALQTALKPQGYTLGRVTHFGDGQSLEAEIKHTERRKPVGTFRQEGIVYDILKGGVLNPPTVRLSVEEQHAEPLIRAIFNTGTHGLAQTDTQTNPGTTTDRRKALPPKQ